MVGRGLSSSRDVDRGQLLLAGAFVLAVALIGLTIVLTSSSYTTTLADRESEVVRGSDAVTVRESVESDLNRQFVHVFDEQPGDPSSSTEDSLKDQFRSVIRPIGNETTTHYSRRGRLVNVTAPPGRDLFIEGTRLKQHTSRAMSSPTNADDWMVAEDVEMRNATMIITDISDIGTSTTSDTMRMFFETPGSSGDWSLTFLEQNRDVDGDGTNEIAWVVKSTSPDGRERECVREEVDNNFELTIDLDEGTLNGDSCDALTALAPPRNRYDVRVVRGQKVYGRYWFIIDKPESAHLTDYSPSLTDSETVTYGARVRYRYHSGSITYETNIDIAPEELS